MTTTKKQQGAIKRTDEWMAKQETRVNKIIARNFSASFMSNAKWRKALSLLSDSQYPIGNYRWKFVDDERIFETQIIGLDEIEETHLTDGKNQPFTYKEVEWLEVVTNHDKEITDELLKRGQFALDKSESGFRIIGYAS